VSGFTITVAGHSLPLMYAYGRGVAVVELDAPALDFLLSYLPHDDGFTKDLEKLRERAKDELWSRQ
jgi:hypothetical protein